MICLSAELVNEIENKDPACDVRIPQKLLTQLLNQTSMTNALILYSKLGLYKLFCFATEEYLDYREQVVKEVKGLSI